MASTTKKKPASFAASFASGSLSGAFSTLLFQPLDLAKTRLQVRRPSSGTGAPLSGPQPPTGAIGVMVDVVRKENVAGLWKGLTPSLVRTVPGVGLYFSILHGIQYSLLPSNQTPSPVVAGGIAAVARGVTCATLLPFTVVKTRFESGSFHYRNVYHAMCSMQRREGFRSLYSGMLATLLRDVPSSSLYYTFYTASKSYAKDHYPGEHLRKINMVCAMYSACMACIMTHPVDVVKTRLQTDGSHTKGTIPVARAMFQEEGLSAFFRGAQARIARRSCVIGLSWTVYEAVISFVSSVL